MRVDRRVKVSRLGQMLSYVVKLTRLDYKSMTCFSFLGFNEKR